MGLVLPTFIRQGQNNMLVISCDMDQNENGYKYSSSNIYTQFII